MMISMKRAGTCIILQLSCVFLFVGIFASSTGAADDQQLFNQARRSYYNLKREGVSEFRCHVTLDWEAFLDAVKADAARKEELLPILKKTHFEVLVGPDGAAFVSHQFDLAPPSEEVASRIQAMSGGFEQMITGFFQTWSQFMINSLFPSPKEKYELTNEGQTYRLSSSEGSTEVFMSFGHDFALDEMQMKSAGFDATVHPILVRTDRGFVLRSYTATYKASTGATQQIAVSIEYLPIQGLTLPSTVKASVTSPNGPVEISLKFDDYSFTKH